MNRVFIGKEDVVEDLLVCLLAGGHVLLEDVPGVGKTTLAGVLAWGRYYGWSDTDHAPIETILFFPGLPLLGALLGITAGFLVWKKLWTPQVVKHHRAGEQWKRWK